jgi:hypothetical protein
MFSNISPNNLYYVSISRSTNIIIIIIITKVAMSKQSSKLYQSKMKESKKPTTGNFEQKMEVRVNGGEKHFIIQASLDGKPQ